MVICRDEKFVVWIVKFSLIDPVVNLKNKGPRRYIDNFLVHFVYFIGVEKARLKIDYDNVINENMTLK